MYPLLCSISSKVWNYQRYNEERKSNKDRQWNGLKPNPEGQWYLHRKPKIEQSESNKKPGGEFICSEWLSRITTILHQSILLACVTVALSSSERKEHTF